MKKFKFTYFNMTKWIWAKVVIKAISKEEAIEKFKEKYSEEYDKIIELK